MTPRKRDRPSRSKAVSLDPDRDSAKVTMQTRVAVRDKIPHRFQIVPLREILKLPAPLPTPPDEATGSRVSRLSSSRSGKFSVHLDEPGTGKETRSLGRSSGKMALQEIDVNQEISESTHKDTKPLEIAPVFEESFSPALPTVSSKSHALSHGYSQSLNQYSFRLKPWKSYTHLQGSPRRTNASADNRDLEMNKPSELEGRFGITSRDTHSPDPPYSNEEEDPGSPKQGSESDSPDYLFSGFSRTLHDSDGLLDLSPKLPDSKKRHAIYSTVGYLPLERQNFMADGERHVDLMPAAGAVLNLEGTSRLRSPRLDHSLSPQLLPPPCALPAKTRPLKLLQHSRITPSAHNTDPLLYPEAVLDLLQQLDAAIESWRHSSC
ncbi:hypothetical protein DFP72DRAFT_570923 [Ephemerocybe angulata]|uniref:Uncharacterized protein n=1 Tax=Ephemerocybe angulata TaxID=980116 RepID=A0A8H6MBB4_9AGAR|nr:hypothetical protein DFP72DRAFT_570923 [Tulosesus angulatus]